MSKSQRRLQPCIAQLRDGSRCGRYAQAGGDFCSVHKQGYKPSGAAVPKPKPISHEERLARFAESNDPRVAMQAIGILERRFSDSVNDSGARRREATTRFLAALTPDERLQLESILAALRSFKEDIYASRPDLRPAWETIPQDTTPQPARTSSSPADAVLDEAPTPEVNESTGDAGTLDDDDFVVIDHDLT